MKLYHVTCQGVTVKIAPVHGVAYVLAEDAETAYQKLRKYLDDKDLGYVHDRELDSIKLIADDVEYPLTTRLIL